MKAVYTFYPDDGGEMITRRYFRSDDEACKFAAQLCDELGVSIEVAKGEELDLLAVYDPD